MATGRKISMTLKKEIEERIGTIFEEFKNTDMTDVELIERLRKEAEKSSVFFHIFIETVLGVAYSRGYIILSKGLLKYYLKSDYKTKTMDDYLAYDDHTDEDIITPSGKVLHKGLLIKILERLALTETLQAYIKYLILVEDEDEPDSDKSSSETTDTSAVRESLLGLLWKEFDEKVSTDNKLLQFSEE